MGSRHPHVMVYQIRPPASAEAVLGGESLVIGKRELARTLAGDASIQSRVECLRRILKRWASEPVAGTRTDRVLAATVTAGEARFIGAGYLRKVPVLLIGLDTHVTTDVDAQIAACLRVDGDESHADDAEYEGARRVIQQWADCNAASDSAGVLAAPPVNRKRLLNRVDATLQNAPPHLRASRARIAAKARLIASAAHGAAIEQELETFIESQMPDDDWLKGLASIAVRPTAPPGTDGPFELRGLLLLRPLPGTVRGSPS